MYQKILIIFYIINLTPLIFSDINIHIIPHSHLDPGWINTPEEYFSQKEIYNIFNTVLNSIYNDPQNRRTFIINEIYYFKKWYNQRNSSEKQIFKKLIQEKRIEFTLGGHVAHDEANPSYYDIEDQIRLGNQFLLEEFGITPETAWFIDSFGHSAGNAYLMARYNFKNLVLGRMHYDYLELIKNRKNIEFYWTPFNLDKKIFTHILPLHYNLNMEELRMDTIIFKSTLNNFLEDLLKQLYEIYRSVHHKNVMFLYGDDFEYTDDHLFYNIEYLIEIFQNTKDIKYLSIQKQAQLIFGTNEKINFIYSTPSKYFEEVKKELKENNIQLMDYSLDFYPLKTNCFWTGFFTSRPYLKGYIRKASNIFYAMSKYFSVNKLLGKKRNNYRNIISKLNKYRENIGLSQHHDAITGTSTRSVSQYYYNNHIYDIFDMEKELKSNLQKDFNMKIGNICYNNYIVDQKECNKEFIISDSSKIKKIKIGLLNPNTFLLSNKLLIEIEFVDSLYYYEIEGIKSDFFCINEKNLKNINLFKYRNKCFLNFFYEFKSGEQISYVTLKLKNEIKNEYYQLNKIIDIPKIDLIKDKSRIKNLAFYPNEFKFKLEYNSEQKLKSLDFTYYDGMYYVNLGECPDGAYQFSPYNKYPEKIPIDYYNSFYFIGNIGITFVTRNKETSFTFFQIFYNPFFVKVQHFFDSVTDSYFLNRFSFGYVFTFKTNINNTKDDKYPLFYTDANGLEMIQRKIDRFSLNETIDVSNGGNFYPVTSCISIKDEKEQNDNIVTIFNDRPQAGTSISPGSISLIIQRMSYGSDNNGLEENLYEAESMENYDFRTTHFIMFGLNINNDRNYNSISNLEIKTNSLNFMYNYFNSAFIMFKILQEYNIDKGINERNYKIKDYFTKNINLAPDIRVHYELIDNKLIIGIFFRYYNSYFDNNNNKINKEYYGFIEFNFTEKTKFRIYSDNKGIDYSINKLNIISEENLKKFEIPKNQKFLLDYDEFLYIYFYID